MTDKTLSKSRISSIDFLRGIVMVLMALDHSRTFLHSDFIVFNAEDLTKTTPALFFTRWVTHFCAPVFIFLAGLSASLLLQKTGSKRKLFNYLLIRGLILILLELTLFRVCWQRGMFLLDPYISLLVIWAIGISMIFLALLIWLPVRIILCLGLVILLFHNTLAGIHFPENSSMAIFWAFLYSGGGGMIVGDIYISFLYPALPYFGIIALGYCLGHFYSSRYKSMQKRKILTGIGLGAIVLFFILRFFNLYGDPRPWQPGNTAVFSLLSFLRTTKYPVSLHFTLMTLGPALVVLGLMEQRLLKSAGKTINNFFITIGSVPFFYYILHLILFVLIGYLAGFNRYSLAMVYCWFAVVVGILFILCKWYARYKFRHPERRWLRFL